MGQQIAIAQDKPDEDATLEFIRARGEFFALPRVQEEPRFKPVPAGLCDAQSQIIVPKSLLDEVLATGQESSDDPGQFAVDFSVTSGMFIEWRRTLWLKSNLAKAGRFYLARARGHNSESIVALTRAMTALQRFIRSEYPARTNERYPVYIGPAMWEHVKKGKVRVLSSSGEEVDLVKNQ
jgi:hypothetical protein